MSKELLEIATGKKKRIQKDVDSICNAALAMDLDKRVDLRNRLIESIENEVQCLKELAENAAKIANGKP